MIEQLSVQNLAIIDRATIEFTGGLNVISGETGAGKSLLVGALSLLFGGKASPDTVGPFGDETVVSAQVSFPQGHPALAWLAERGIEPDEGSVLLRRSVKRQGRGVIYVQSNPVTREELAEFMGLAVDMHGQHEHQSLLVETRHRELLDAFGELTEEVALVRGRVSQAADIRRRLESLRQSAGDRDRDLELARFAIDEIDRIAPQIGEDQELEAERSRLNQYERLFATVSEARERAHGEDGGLVSGMRALSARLNDAAEIDADLSSLAGRIESLYYEFSDASSELSAYAERLAFDPDRLEFVESRLATLQNLKRKYGGSLDAVLEHRNEAEDRIADLQNWEGNTRDLEDRLKQIQRAALDAARALSERRKVAAVGLAERVLEGLSALGMERARFAVSVEQRTGPSGGPSLGATGMDEVRFLIAANPGQEPRPLKTVASGGEISRVMLALKTALSAADTIDTLVFDEVDAGIGGEIARAVGRYLARLGRSHQVLCITHLATVAAGADNHIRVEKVVEQERTRTRVHGLDQESRIREIARMLSGDSNTSVSLEHARELLQEVSSATKAADTSG